MRENKLQAIRQDIINAFAFNEFSASSSAIDNCQLAGKTTDLNNYDDNKNVVGSRQVYNIAATRRRGSSSCPLPANAFYHTKVVRAVNQLSDHQNQLALYCYVGKHTDWPITQGLSLYIWEHLLVFIEAFEQQQTSLKQLKSAPGKAPVIYQISQDKKQKLKALVFNGLMHYRAATTGQKLYTVDLLCSLLGISSSNWRRDWAPFWRQILKTLSILDESLLKNVDLSVQVSKVA